MTLEVETLFDADRRIWNETGADFLVLIWSLECDAMVFFDHMSRYAQGLA